MEGERVNIKPTEYLTWFGHMEVVNNWVILNYSDYLFAISKMGGTQLS